MRGLVVACIVLAGCRTPGPQRIGAQPSWRQRQAHVVAAGPVTFAPSSEPAARYNEAPQPPPKTPLGDAVIAAVQEAAVQAGVRVPEADGRLFRACAELAEIVPPDGSLSYALIEFALQRSGIIEPSPHLLVVGAGADAPDRVVEQLVEQLRPRLPDLLAEGTVSRMGVGMAKAADGSIQVVFAVQGSGVSTRPIPRGVELGGAIAIDAVVDARYHDPELFVARETGEVQRIELRPGRPGGFTAEVACGAHRGRQQIEITASGAAGSTVLANFPVWCGASPPTSVTYDPVLHDLPAASPEQAEQRLLASVNRDRAAAGLPILLWDERLAEVARGHSADMRRTRIVAHISPTTGSAADRLRAAKVRTAVVLENVARAYGIQEAHDGLMNSPGHRANLMSPRATHLGIGVSFGDELVRGREMFITQVFTRVPPPIDLAEARREVLAKIHAVHPGLSASDALAPLSQRLADALAAGSSREAAYAQVNGDLERLGSRYSRVGTVISALSELDSLDAASLLSDTYGQDIGVGVAQGPHPEIGDGAIWLVALVASRR